MKIFIKNIGRIEEAEIVIDGLTIVAGQNGTGKSTIGRALYSIFRSFYKIDKTIYNTRKRAIIRRFMTLDNYESPFIFAQRDEELNELIGEVNLEKIESILKKMGLYEEVKEDEIKSLIKQIYDINNLSEKEIIFEETEETFNREFNNNITNIFSGNQYGSVKLSIKSKDILIKFKNNDLVSMLEYFSLSYEPIYIDDPFIIDSNNKFIRARNDKTHRQFLMSQYRRENNVEFNAADELLLKNNLSQVLGKIETILNEDEIDYTYRGERSQSKKNISIDNLSSGMKTFFLLKTLISNGTITSNSPVILDEPEVHLHPEWQLILAEIIVILQKELSIHFLINTHSPYFLRAIEVYSKKHDITNQVKFYNSQNVDRYKSRIVEAPTTKIYEHLTMPLKKIENERSTF